MSDHTHRRRAGYSSEQESLLVTLYREDLISEEKFNVRQMRERLLSLSPEERCGLDGFTDKQLMDKLRCMKKKL